MTEGPASHRRVTERLGFQLAFILAAVLLPLAAISLSTSLALVSEVRARAEAALLGETMQAASNELRLIQRARGAAELLAERIGDLVADDTLCSRALSDIVARHPEYALVAFVPVTGPMRCSSYGRQVDLSDRPVFLRLLDEPEPDIFVNPHALTTGTSVLGVSNPVFDQAGAFLGVVFLSLPHTTLNAPEGERATKPTLALFTFDRAGEVLTASTGLDDLSALPRDRALAALAGSKALAFTTPSQAGQERVYSIVPLVPGELFALGTRIAENSAVAGRTLASTPILLPLLMWLASLVAAWLAVERLVTRNVRKLSKSIKSFASGNRIVGDIEVGRAPIEIRDMAEAYDLMTEAVMRDEAELENSIHQKEVLLREVHHRVKNNLQLIASIMNMQVRRVRSSEARQMLSEIRDRVMSLATIHRELFETAGQADVHSDELLTSIVRQVTSSGLDPDRRFIAHTHLEDIRLVPDQAVPLGLLVAEALTGAMKHGKDADGENVQIRIGLHRSNEDEAVLEIANSSATPENMAELHTGLDTQLIAAFAMQIGGKVERERRDGEYRLRVSFRLRPLSEAEPRHEGQHVA